MRENTTSQQKHSKDLYDLGANSRVFLVGDRVHVRLESIARSSGKLLSKWSDLYEVVGVRGVVISLKDPKTGQLLNVHADRLSNTNRHLRDESRDAHALAPSLRDFENENFDFVKDRTPARELSFLETKRSLG